MNFKYKKFEELTSKELYEILKARAEIFIVEQNINYQDMDDIDYRSIHFYYEDNDKVVAYLRAFYVSEDTLQIGRVLTIVHGNGLGKKFFKESIDIIKEKFNCHKIVLNAQTHAIGFYEQFGFKVISDEFLEDEIMHVKMQLDI